jgi:hypothetical protein
MKKKIMNSKHLVWILWGVLVSFATSFIFGDLLILPVDLYYLIYFCIMVLFFMIYIKKTQVDLKGTFSKRLFQGIILGIIFGVIMVNKVWSMPETEKYTGFYLTWAVFWRGLIYGAIDGLLLSAFPWIVTWHAFRAEVKPLGKKVLCGLLAWCFILAVTSAYHAGYRDFRSKKIIQANIGNTLISIPTLLAANPLGAPIAHMALHVAAVIHTPKTTLFLPPHR